ncbi:MAG: hypothetical protein RL685_1724 [Pseudomonadota bacterium]
MGSRVVVAAVLLAVGCNQLTGVGDLKVSSCGADAGADAGACETGLNPLNVRDGDSADDARDPERGGGGVGSGDGEGAGGGSNRVGGPLGSAGTEGDVPRGFVPGTFSCEPDSELQCLGAGNCAGTQSCLDDGESVSSCACGPAPVLRRDSVGAACDSDEDCSAGLGCTTAEATSGPFVNGGAQGGYCSRPCSGDADCRSSDPGAACVSYASGAAFCLQGCDPLLPSFPGQCNGRSELTCLPDELGERAYCVPACQTDSDCAPRACDLSTGYCRDSVRDGEPIGGACAADDDCAGGVCRTLPGQTPACTGLCTFGSIAGCGFGADDSPRLAACTTSAGGGELAVLLGIGVGPGLCQELCDEDDDCAQAENGWGCTPWPDLLDNAERFDSIGFCEPQDGDGDGGDGLCNDSCLFAADGACDDGGAGSFIPVCELGTDCLDCGPR